MMCRWSVLSANITKTVGTILTLSSIFDIVNGQKILCYNIATTQMVKKFNQYLYFIKKKEA